MSEPGQKPPAFSRAAENLIAAFRGLPADSLRSRPRQTRKLGELVGNILTRYHLGVPSAEETVRAQWPQLVGPANAGYSHPLRIERSAKLLVQVSHPVVRNELHLHRETILKRLKALPGCENIKDLIFRAG